MERFTGTLSLLLLLSIAIVAAIAIAPTDNDMEASVLNVVGHSSDSLSFTRFISRYGKRYKTEKEVRVRFMIFAKNLKQIKSHNSKRLSYTLGVNQFTDLTWDEFRKQRLGAAQNCSATKNGNHKLTNYPLPETKDWRKEGMVSPVKDQGACGSCWSFSATGSLEAAYTQSYRKNISLSEQQLCDCAQAYNNFGCRGGLPSQAFEYVKFIGGLETDAAYPYTATDGKCKFSTNKIAVKVVDSVNITMDAEDELKHAVALVRPVSVAFQVVSDFQSYKSGVYTSNTCGKTPMDVNHAVLAVGYGVEKGMPYWIIKNSWGAEWGDHGYFKMELGKNMCGVATCASYPIIA